jgi:hypothetical protein
MPGIARITTSAVSPASSLAWRAPTVAKSKSTSWPASSANALPSAPTATCIDRAHITLSLAMPVPCHILHVMPALVAGIPLKESTVPA